MLYSLKKSKQSTFVSYNLQKQLHLDNARSSCKSYIFHKIKTFPIEKQDLNLTNQQLNFDQTRCAVKILNQNSRKLIYTFTTTISSKDSKTKSEYSYHVKGHKKRLYNRKNQVKWVIQTLDLDDLPMDDY